MNPTVDILSLDHAGRSDPAGSGAVRRASASTLRQIWHSQLNSADSPRKVLRFLIAFVSVACTISLQTS